MLKSQVPVYICSTVFSIVLFPSSEWHESRAAASTTANKTVAHRVVISKSKFAKISMAPPPNSAEMKLVRNYIRRNDHCLFHVKERSDVPFGIIDSVFTRYGLPHELKYLAVIESELKPTALSPVGAKGPWQLMPATAHIFGLKTNSQTDDRMNYYKSTKAAARYLKDLYHLFGDWLLVLAAYNGGPGPVYTAIHKSHTRNFWKLQKYLPAESRQHVKKFIATDYYFKETENRSVPEKHNKANDRALAKNLLAPVKESTNEKFARLMNESARSLQQSQAMLDN